MPTEGTSTTATQDLYDDYAELTELTIPSTISYEGKVYNVIRIGYAAFNQCNLTYVDIPSSIKTIGVGAFSNCSSLTSITLKEGLEHIDGNAFADCRLLETITFPNSLKTVGSYAFSFTAWYNNQPNGGVYAGNVFYKYKGDIPENTSFVIKEGTVSISPDAFIKENRRIDYGLVAVAIPNSVEIIGEYAFSQCRALRSVNIPSRVTTIESYALSYCKSLTSVTSEIVEPLSLPSDVFFKASVANATLYVPAESVDAYKNADQWKDFGQILPIAENPEDLFPTLTGLQRTEVKVHTTGTDAPHIVSFDEYTHYVPYNKQRIYLTNDGLTFLREENSQVLFYAPSYGIKEDVVLYDWTLEVGDTLPYNKYTLLKEADFIVTNVSTITLLDGKEYKKWTLACGIEYIEGIGAINGGGYGNYFCLQCSESPAIYIENRLVCASRNGQLLYQMDDAEMERLGAECLCDYDRGPLKDNAKNGKIGGRPTPTQWNQLELDLREMENGNTILRAETFSYTLENDSIVANGKTYYQLARQSTKDTATTKSFVGALHFGEDEDNRVYFFRDGVEYVLYDFTAEPGDTIEIFAGINNYPQDSTYTHVVMGKDTLENGACRMLLEVVFPAETATAENAEKVWLAGLGSVDGIVHNAATRATTARSSDTQTSVMLCAWRDDNCLYTTDHPDYNSLGCVYNIDEMTSVEDTHSSLPMTDCYKLLRNGQLLIIHKGKTYNVLGVPVE